MTAFGREQIGVPTARMGALTRQAVSRRRSGHSMVGVQTPKADFDEILSASG